MHQQGSSHISVERMETIGMHQRGSSHISVKRMETIGTHQRSSSHISVIKNGNYWYPSTGFFSYFCNKEWKLLVPINGVLLIFL